MALSIRSDTHTTKVLGNLKQNTLMNNKAVGNLATGLKVKTAADDASGFSIAYRMRVRVRSFEQDLRNAQNGASLLRTATNAVDDTIGMIRELKEKTLNAANDHNTDDDRAVIQKELDQIIKQIDENAYSTYNTKHLLLGAEGSSPKVNYNYGVKEQHSGKTLMDTVMESSVISDALENLADKTENDIEGEYYDFSDYKRASVFNFQLGSKANITTTVTLRDMTATSLGLMDGNQQNLQVTSREKATNALDFIDRALSYALIEQNTISAAMTRLEAAKENLTVNIENTTNSKSTITDADMAQEMVAFTRSNLLTNSSTSMLSQANQAHEDALFLLQ